MLLLLPLFLTIPWVWFFLGFYWEPDPFGTRTTRWLAGILAVSLSFRVVFQVLALWGACTPCIPFAMREAWSGKCRPYRRGLRRPAQRCPFSTRSR